MGTPPAVKPILAQTERDAEVTVRRLTGIDRIGLDCEFRPNAQYLSDEWRAILASGTDEQRLKLVAQDDFKRVSFDPFRNELLTLQVGWRENDRLYGLVLDALKLDHEFIANLLRPVLTNSDVTVLGVNLGVELKQWLVFVSRLQKKYRYRIECQLRDLMWRERTLTSGQVEKIWSTDPRTKEPIQVLIPVKTGLAALRTRYLGYDKAAAEEEKDTTRLSFIWSEGLTPEQIDYAARDVGDLLPIDDLQMIEFQKEENQRLIQVAQWEDEVVPVIADMELRGITLDVPSWTELAVEADQETERLYGDLQLVFIPESYKRAVGDAIQGLDLRLLKMVDPNSPKDLMRALKAYGFDDICDPRCEREKSGRHAFGCVPFSDTDSNTLYEYRRAWLSRFKKTECPPLDTLLKYREWSQRKKAFGHVWLENVNPITSRVHGSFKQSGADSGRFTCSVYAGGSLQQIPSRSSFGKRCRDCFISRLGHKLITSDWSQIELRILAVLAMDPVMIEMFNQGLDLHTAMAARCTQVTYEELDAIRSNKSHPEYDRIDTVRAGAKTVRFGFVYGQGARSASIQTAKQDAKGIGLPAYCKLSKRDVESGKRCSSCTRCIQAELRESEAVAAKWLDDQGQKTFALLFSEDLAGGRRYFHRPDPVTIRRKILVDADKKHEQLTEFEIQRRIREKMGAEEAGLKNEGRNHPIQGLNARMLKIALRRIWERCRKLGAFPVLTVHDEIVVESPCTCGQEECTVECLTQTVKSILVEEMEAAAQLFIKGVVPTPVSATISTRWHK